MQAGNVIAVRAIVEMAVFLEFSPASVLNPDAALDAMEQLSSTLQLMEAGERAEFCSALASIASHYSGEQADFVSDLGASLGLE